MIVTATLNKENVIHLRWGEDLDIFVKKSTFTLSVGEKLLGHAAQLLGHLTKPGLDTAKFYHFPLRSRSFKKIKLPIRSLAKIPIQNPNQIPIIDPMNVNAINKKNAFFAIDNFFIQK